MPNCFGRGLEPSYYLSRPRFRFLIQNLQVSLTLHLSFLTKPLTKILLSQKTCLYAILFTNAFSGLACNAKLLQARPSTILSFIPHQNPLLDIKSPDQLNLSSIISHKTVDLLFIITKTLFACTHALLSTNAHFRLFYHTRLFQARLWATLLSILQQIWLLDAHIVSIDIICIGDDVLQTPPLIPLLYTKSLSKLNPSFMIFFKTVDQKTSSQKVCLHTLLLRNAFLGLFMTPHC